MGISDTGPLFSLTLDDPLLATAYKAHLTSLPPPLVHFSREGEPNLLVVAQLREMPEQLDVSFPGSLFDDVIGMHDKANETVLLFDDLDLLFPQVGGVTVQDVEQPIVLRRGDRELNQVADEVRHHCATPASLRIKMRGVWHRHVVGGLQSVIPLLVAIHDCRTKSARSVVFQILDDSGCPSREL